MMSRKSILVLVVIAGILAAIAKGGDDVAAVVITVVLAGAGCLVALLVLSIPVTIVSAVMERRKLDAAIREYREYK